MSGKRNGSDENEPVEVNSEIEATDMESPNLVKMDIRKDLNELKQCQAELEKLNDKSCKEISEIEKIAEADRNRVYKRRANFIQNIPRFWCTALWNHPKIMFLIEEQESEAFYSLEKLEIENFENGWLIRFTFYENAIFHNRILVKVLESGPNKPLTSYSSEIIWIEDLSQSRDETMAARRLAGIEDTRTFFTWFQDHSDPENDYIAKAIKEEIWTKPFDFYIVDEPEGGIGTVAVRRSNERGIMYAVHGERLQQIQGADSRKNQKVEASSNHEVNELDLADPDAKEADMGEQKENEGKTKDSSDDELQKGDYEFFEYSCDFNFD